jgi:hypothetical protein
LFSDRQKLAFVRAGNNKAHSNAKHCERLFLWAVTSRGSRALRAILCKPIKFTLNAL